MTEIEKMIAAGMTPEEIYKQAVSAKQKSDAAAEENKRKEEMRAKLAEQRKALIKEFNKYIEIINGEKPDNRIMNQFNKELKELEDLMLNEEKPEVKVKVKKYSDKEADAILDKFLKDLGF